MAQEERNRLVEWYQVLRKQGPIARQRVEEWGKAVRAEPRLAWEVPAIRYVTYGLGGLVLLWVVLHVAHWFAPPPPVAAKPRATSADFHVVCGNEECGHHFVIHREFGFKKFPVVCPRCGQKTGMQAQRCNSSTCKGRWVAPVRVDGVRRCPHCGRELP